MDEEPRRIPNHPDDDVVCLRCGARAKAADMQDMCEHSHDRSNLRITGFRYSSRRSEDYIAGYVEGRR